nr:uncharacterized protein LOC109190938 [Ipomoea batatas]
MNTTKEVDNHQRHFKSSKGKFQSNNKGKFLSSKGKFQSSCKAKFQSNNRGKFQSSCKAKFQSSNRVQPDVITQPEVEDNQWEILDEILDAQWHQILVQSEGIDGGKSLSTTNRIAVKSIEELGQDHHAHSQQGSTSVRGNKGKQVMLPSKPRRKKLPIRKYSTRSKDFKSIFFGNDKDPINLD